MITKSESFFQVQSDLTATKIMVYQEYLSNYLPKVLMQFGECYIGDFFCGSGMNGDKKGSPLVLLDIAQKMLEDKRIKKKWPNAKIVIIFSDSNKDCIENLKNNLKNTSLPSNIKILGPFCEEFNSMLIKVKNKFQKVAKPKFYFLDPFTYSAVKIEDVKTLMDMPIAEVLLFLPTFMIHRFLSCAEDINAIQNFLANFSSKQYIEFEDIYNDTIHDFNESIRQRLLSYLNIEYVRTVGLADGARKNALFYLTKHIKGMLIMNKLVWKNDPDGIMIRAGADKNTTLFDLAHIGNNFEKVKNIIQKQIMKKKKMTNVEIIELVAKNCFTTKYARDVLNDMKKNDEIEVEYTNSKKTKTFYVSDDNWNKELSIIKYRR